MADSPQLPIHAKVRVLLQRERRSLVRAVSNALVVGFGLAASRLSAFLVSILVARFAEPETFGLFTLFYTVLLLGSEIPGAFDASYIRHANAPDRKHGASHYLSLSYLSKIGLVVAIAAGAPIVVRVLQDWVATPSMLAAVRDALIAGTLLAVFSTLIAAHQQRKEFTHVSLLRPLPNLAALTVVGMVALAAGTLHSTVISSVYIGTALVFALWTLARHRAGVFAAWGTVTARESRPYFRLAFMLLATAVMTMVAARLDVFILASSLGLEDLAHYGVGMRMALVISIVTSAVTVLLTPKAPEVQGDAKRLRRYLGLGALYSGGQTVIAVVLIYWMPDLIRLFFGPQYAVDLATVAGRVLVLQMLFTAYAIPYQALIQSSVRPNYLFGISVARMIATAAALLVAIPVWGGYGAASALAAVALVFWLVTAGAALRAWRCGQPA